MSKCDDCNNTKMGKERGDNWNNAEYITGEHKEPLKEISDGDVGTVTLGLGRDEHKLDWIRDSSWGTS